MRLLLFPAFPLLFCSALLAAPATVVAKGTQAKGARGRSAELEARSVKLERGATITSVEGAPAGFWIEGSGLHKSFAKAAEAVGLRVPAGGYRVLPNLPAGADRATVSVVFTLD